MYYEATPVKLFGQTLRRGIAQRLRRRAVRVEVAHGDEENHQAEQRLPLEDRFVFVLGALLVAMLPNASKA